MKVPREWMFHGTKVLGTFAPEERKFHRSESSKELMFHGTKVPREQKFSLWSFRSRERKCRGTKRPGIIKSSGGTGISRNNKMSDSLIYVVVLSSLLGHCTFVFVWWFAVVDSVHSDSEPCRKDTAGKVVHAFWWRRETEADWRSARRCYSPWCQTHQLCGSEFVVTALKQKLKTILFLQSF